MSWSFLFHAPSPYGLAALSDPDSCDRRPMGGSETALVRLAAALRRLGHRTTFVDDPRQFVLCDVFVSLRRWQPFARERGPGLVNYLWAHDLPTQGIVAELRDRAVARAVYGNLERVAVVSNYSLDRWVKELHLPPAKSFVAYNAIPLEHFTVDEAALAARPRRAYYASMPNRGLRVLAHVWPEVRARVPEAELVVFSSARLYGREEASDERELMAKLRAQPGVTLAGVVGQIELHDAAMTCRALAYPATVVESSCITAMEAMAAGCAVVTTATGALPETAFQNVLVPPARGWWEAFTDELVRVLRDDEHYLAMARQNLAVSRLRSWDAAAQRWCARVAADLEARRAARAALAAS